MGELYNIAGEGLMDGQHFRVMTSNAFPTHQLEMALNGSANRQLEIALDSLVGHQYEMPLDGLTYRQFEMALGGLASRQYEIAFDGLASCQVEMAFDGLTIGQPEMVVDGPPSSQLEIAFDSPPTSQMEVAFDSFPAQQLEVTVGAFPADHLGRTLQEFRFEKTFAGVRTGKSHFISDLRAQLKARIAKLENQLQIKFELGQGIFFGPLFQDVPPEFQLHSSEWCFSTYNPAASSVMFYLPVDAPVNAYVRRFFSRALGKERTALKLVNKIRTIVLHALQEAHRFVCIAVTRRAAFMVQGFHPPAPSEALIENTLSWRGCGVSPV
ncbi:MAG: hypothetical protein WBQ76_05210 [Candidatus Korobacteraceae bacterium]